VSLYTQANKTYQAPILHWLYKRLKKGDLKNTMKATEKLTWFIMKLIKLKKVRLREKRVRYSGSVWCGL